MKPESRRLLWLILWFSFTIIACNLTQSEKPPTIVPRTSIAATPQPTLGYATSPPSQQNNTVATTVAQQQSQIDVEIYNLLNQVDQDRLVVHVDALVGFYTRHINSTQTSLDRGVGAAFNYINNQLLAIQQQHPNTFTVLPEGQQFPTSYNGVNTYQHNAIGILQGTEANAGVIVVGAHYDSRTDDLTDATGFAPAADDNGSGVAAVLELARVLADKPQRSTIMFVLFSGEEEQRLGSKAFVSAYAEPYLPKENTYMLNLDTIGSWDDSFGNIDDSNIRVFSPGPQESPSRQLARTINFIGFNFGLDLNIMLVDGLDRDGRYGDQESFSDQGYPAIRFIEALEDHVNREGRDTIDKLEPAYLFRSTRTVLGVIISLAGGPRPPRNMALRQDDNSAGQYLVWEPVPGATSYIVAIRRNDDLNVSQQFTVVDSRTPPWDRWHDYEAVSIAAVDAQGMIGPLSAEYLISGL